MRGRFLVLAFLGVCVGCSADVEMNGEQKASIGVVESCGCLERKTDTCFAGTTIEHCGIDGDECGACTDGEACVDGLCSPSCSTSEQCASENSCVKPFCATGTTSTCVTAYATNLQACDGDNDGVKDDHCFGFGGCCDGCVDMVCDGDDCAFTCLQACPTGEVCSSSGSCYVKP